MTDKMREEFEVWYEGVTGLPVEFNDAGIPVSIGSALSETVTMGMWVAWRASRESLCVNLPDSERSVEVLFSATLVGNEIEITTGQFPMYEQQGVDIALEIGKDIQVTEDFVQRCPLRVYPTLTISIITVSKICNRIAQLSGHSPDFIISMGIVLQTR